MDIKDRILKSALKLFVHQGFGTSTSAITRDAGVSSGILFHYFPTKLDLIVALYTEYVLEHFRTTTYIMEDRIPIDDVEMYRKMVWQTWEDRKNWALENWEKFAYVLLFDSSHLAKQFKLNGHSEVDDLLEKLYSFTCIGIEYGYLRNLPATYLLSLSLTANAATIRFLHEHPEYQCDQAFINAAWQTQWEMIAG